MNKSQRGRRGQIALPPPIEIPPIELEVIQQVVPKNFLEVGTSGKGEVVVNYPDDTGGGHLIFSVEEARAFAKAMMSTALDAEMERRHGR